ncbi:MAG: hypothetical protein AB2556_23355 [Candidatus Thiodiazotropha sp.]
MHPKGYCRICLTSRDKATPRPAQWRDKGEQLYMSLWHAVYLPSPEYVSQVKDVPTLSLQLPAKSETQTRPTSPH